MAVSSPATTPFPRVSCHVALPRSDHTTAGNLVMLEYVKVGAELRRFGGVSKIKLAP